VEKAVNKYYSKKDSYNYRYERKLVTTLSVHQVELLIKHHPAFFNEIYFQRQIFNIYFDTVDLRFFRANQDGIASRKKIRIRWYGDIRGQTEKPVLEVKIKSGEVGYKLLFPLRSFSSHEPIDITHLNKIFSNSELPGWLREEMSVLTPSLLNSYQRKYFLSTNKKYRLTMDFELNYMQLNRHYNPLNRSYENKHSVVVEIKYDRHANDDASLITGHFPFRMVKNSKYTNGIDITRFATV